MHDPLHFNLLFSYLNLCLELLTLDLAFFEHLGLLVTYSFSCCNYFIFGLANTLFQWQTS